MRSDTCGSARLESMSSRQAAKRLPATSVSAHSRIPFLRHWRRSCSNQLYPFGAREPLQGQPHNCFLHNARWPGKFKNKQSEQFRYLLRRRRTRKKLLASQSVVSAFTSEQRRRHVTFCGKGGTRKRADVFLAKKNGAKRTLLRRGSSSWAATRALALAACLACPIALRFSRALGACAISPVRALLF